MVDKELIEIWRDSLKPSISLWLLNTNYEEMGEQDKEEFERDFDEILDLALIGLKYKAQLSQEGTTKDATSDTISRQAAIDAIIEDKICDDSLKIMAAMGSGDKAETLNMTCDRHVKMLMSLPSVQPERKVGEWTEDNACEFCGFKPWYERDIHTLSYCPNCGADMRGEQYE